MSILNVARAGNPVLRTQSDSISRATIGSSAVQRLIDDMLTTMADYRSLALTAPQIHEPLRIVVLATSIVAGLDQPVAMINPVVTGADTEQANGWEGCASVPGVHGLVPRPRSLTVKALDRRGNSMQLHLKEFAARVTHHALDHLDGLLFIDRMTALNTLVFSEYAPKDAQVL